MFAFMEKERHIIIEYHYRDAGNFKVHGLKCFSNKQNIPLSEVEARIRERLIDQFYFFPEKWGFRRLSFESFIPDLDHEWYELESVFEDFPVDEAVEDIGELLERGSGL